jgi:hypothetical protein
MKLILDKDIHNPVGVRQISDADIHTEVPTEPPADPAPAHRDRLNKALKALDEFRATRGHHGAEFTSKSGKVHRVGDRVSVDGHKGTITGKHPSSGLPEIAWDK